MFCRNVNACSHKTNGELQHQLPGELWVIIPQLDANGQSFQTFLKRGKAHSLLSSLVLWFFFSCPRVDYNRLLMPEAGIGTVWRYQLGTKIVFSFIFHLTTGIFPEPVGKEDLQRHNSYAEQPIWAVFPCLLRLNSWVQERQREGTSEWPSLRVNYWDLPSVGMFSHPRLAEATRKVVWKQSLSSYSNKSSPKRLREQIW